jgi:hypothetical protein
MTFSQSNRNLTSAERILVNRLIREGHNNSNVNRQLVGHQDKNGLALRLISDAYIDRIRGTFTRFDTILYSDFNHAYSEDQKTAAREGIEYMERGHSMSGTLEKLWMTYPCARHRLHRAQSAS